MQRARTEHLDRIAAAGDVLLLGDGDGRFLEQLLIRRAEMGKGRQVISVDASAAMIARARERIAGLPGSQRVRFVHGPIEGFRPPDPFRPEAVSAHFVFDCFTDRELPEIVDRLGETIAEGGIMVISDFAVPPASAWMHWPARILIGLMYAFFRVASALPARRLPDFHKALSGNDWREVARAHWLAGLVFSSVWERGR